MNPPTVKLEMCGNKYKVCIEVEFSTYLLIQSVSDLYRLDIGCVPIVGSWATYRELWIMGDIVGVE